MSVSESMPTRLGFPEWSSDDLSDIIDYIKQGDCVLIHEEGQDTEIFHNCVSKKLGDKEIEPISLDSIRVISVDIAARKSLLNKSEWPERIEEAGCVHCTCDLKERVTSAQEGIPHFYRTTLGS